MKFDHLVKHDGVFYVSGSDVPNEPIPEVFENSTENKNADETLDNADEVVDTQKRNKRS
ncbi:hypothetical protein [Robinsoniella peoriensis]|uniref:hypothetical protein n=1 Tax=Robinsoniella peoriensis TaxID=180332 RepID=UPI00159EF528|nr:hypothetical protein [Robinsoniella peoriensis]MDU7031281.1 hypothetical protein [Clostridiales bacterium]